jgi:hypothetical protein
MRKNIQQKINKTIDSFNFDVKKWDNYGCLSEISKYKAKKRTKNVKVIGTVYKKKGVEGDFDWQIKSGLYEDSLFIFNDNEENNKHKRAGKGNAVIRKYNKYALPDRPRSVGIITGTLENGGYNNLTKEVKDIIDKNIEEIKDIIRKHGYKKVYYSAESDNGLLGTSIFKVDDSVIKYITRQIHSLSELSEEDGYEIHNGDWSNDTGTPITDISDELYDEKKDEVNKEKSPVYTATKRCIGKDIFLNIVKMAYEVNKFDSIKNIIRRKLNFNKIPVLIRSLPQIPKLMPVGVELIPRKEIGEDPFVYIFIYKPKEGLYKLGVYIKFSDRSLNMYRRYAFKYDAEPKPETLVDWIVNIILNLIIDVYINNKKLKDFFTNMKDKKDKKDQKLDVLLDWFFDPAYEILLV